MNQLRTVEPLPKKPQLWPVTLFVVVAIVAELAAMRWAGSRYRHTGVDQVAMATLPVWLAFAAWLMWKYAVRAIPLLFLTFVLLGGGWAIISLFNFTRPSSIRAACANNLKQIGFALQMYYQKNSSFPPAYVADASGMPICSWRVLILPHMERPDVYRNYNFHEPWDGPHNRKLAETIIGGYRCPWDRTVDKLAITNFVAVVGPRTAWPGATGSKLEDFKDGPANTILVVEVAGSDFPWAQPRDLCVGQMPISPGPPGPSSPHPGNGFWALFADGSTRYLRGDLDDATYWALLSRDGGEKVDPAECSVVFPRNSN